MDSIDCNTGLLLGLGFSHGRPHDSDFRSTDPENETKKKLILKFDDIIPSLTLGLSGQVFHSSVSEIIVGKSAGADDLLRQGSSASAISSFSNSSTLKRERDIYVGGEEKEAEVEAEIETETETGVGVFFERECLKVGEEEEDGSPRKKLRLTKEQSAILEDGFKEHASLSPKQKQELARQLNLRPRQVEVWFQNRRARTKLKQTEMDCELLKKCCEKLKEENSRLQKELQELKSLKLMAPPFCMQLQAAATLTVCPSCERSICIGADESPSSTAFSIGPKPHFLKYPFSHPSAAC